MLPIDQWPWQELSALVLSPGVPLTHPKPHAVVELANRHNCPIIGDVELLCRACPDARTIAITGTNGKSTTTTLIGHILREAGLKTEIGGNLGTPALALEPLGKDGIYVLELSSYQLDLLQTARFNVAVFLNVTPDHLDRHGDMAGYIAAKMHIFDRQQPDDVAVIAVDDVYMQGIRDWAWGIGGRRVVEVSNQHALPAGVYVHKGMLHDNSPLMPHAQSPMSLTQITSLTGRHNWQNAAAAYAAARACGIAPDVIYSAMQSFPGLRHRLQLVATINGVRFINDSKATNADAVSHALAPYETIYWIAGGKAKAGGIESLSRYFPTIKHAFLIGAAENEFAQTLEGKVPYTRSHTLESAVTQAAEHAFADGKKNAVVLLSPACASFDQFKSFEQRGDVFCDLVSALSHRERDGGSRGEGASTHSNELIIPHPNPLPAGEGEGDTHAL
jgi:UDP-N-acetylmuramoylalanine--D-glutamate ligase